MAWYLAPALKKLLAEVNAAHPNRSKASDGSVGDLAHSARKSDHNPAPPSMVVRAIDITNKDIDVSELIRCAIADDRTEYIISRSKIYKRSNGFRPENYTGSNPHDKHVHISARHGVSYENSVVPWGYGKTSGGAAKPEEEDDMTPEQEAKLNKIFEYVSVPGQPYGWPQATANSVRAVEEKLKATLDVPGQGFGYPQATHNAVGVLIGQVEALLAVVAALSNSPGGLTSEEIKNVAYEGARKALESITVTITAPEK